MSFQKTLLASIIASMGGGKIGLVATRGEIPLVRAVSNTSNKLRATGRSRHKAGKSAITSIGASWTNYYIDISRNQIVIGNAVMLRAHIEIPGAPTPVVQLNFAGASSGLIPDGSTDFPSDLLPASAFGLTTIPAGQVFYVVTEFTVALNEALPCGPAPVDTGEGGTYGDGTATQIGTAGTITNQSGGAVTTAIPIPAAVIGRTAFPIASAVFEGDSILFGAGDGGPSNVGGGGGESAGGFAPRGAWDIGSGYALPWIRQSRTGSTAQQAAANYSMLSGVWKYATHFFLTLGSNDLNTGRSAAQTLADLKTLWAAAKAAGIQWVEQMQIVNRCSSSSDSWSTVANQTILTGFENGGSKKDPLNALIAANVGADGLDDFLNVNGLWADTGSTDKLRAPGYTTDGAHPSATAAAAMATDAARRFANWTNTGARYTLPSPLPLWDFESLTGVTNGANNTSSLDSTRKVQGNYSIQAAGNGATATATITKTQAAGVPNTMGVVAAYIDTSLIDNNISSVGIYLQQGATSATVSKSNVNGSFRRCGQWIAADVSEFGAFGALSSSAAIITRMSISQANTYSSLVSCDAMYKNAKGRPTILFTFDDGEDTHLTVAAPALAANGWKGTAYIPTGYIAGANKLTWANVQTLYDTYGWDVGLNTSTDASMVGGTWANPAAVVADLQATQSNLSGRGMTRALNHLCYSNGAWTVAPTQITASTTSNATTTVTMASTTGITAGMAVSGYQVPVGTTVVSNDSGTNLTLSQSIPAQTKPLGYKDTSSPFYRDALVDALEAAGILTGRTTEPATMFTRFGIGKAGLTLPAQSTSASVALATLTAKVDEAVLRGSTLIFYIHKITTGATGINMETQTFTDLLAYVKTFTDSNQADVLTISQLWARDGTASLPD